MMHGTYNVKKGHILFCLHEIERNSCKICITEMNSEFANRLYVNCVFVHSTFCHLVKQEIVVYYEKLPKNFYWG